MSKNDSGENQHNRFNGQHMTHPNVHQHYGIYPGNVGINNQTIANCQNVQLQSQYNPRNQIYPFVQPRPNNLCTPQYQNQHHLQQQQPQHRQPNPSQMIPPHMIPENLLQFNTTGHQNQYMSSLNTLSQIYQSNHPQPAQNPIINQPPRMQQPQHQIQGFHPQYNQHSYPYSSHPQQIHHNSPMYHTFNPMQPNHHPQTMVYTQATPQPIQLTSSQSKPTIDLHPTPHITHPQSQIQHNMYPHQQPVSSVPSVQPMQPMQPVQSQTFLKNQSTTMLNSSFQNNNITNDIINTPPMNNSSYENKSTDKHVLEIFNPETKAKVNLLSYRTENTFKSTTEAHICANGDSNSELTSSIKQSKMNHNQSLLIVEPVPVLKEAENIILDENNDNNKQDDNISNDNNGQYNDDISVKDDIIEKIVENVVSVELTEAANNQDKSTNEFDSHNNSVLIENNSEIKEEIYDNDIQTNVTQDEIVPVLNNNTYDTCTKENIVTTQHLPTSSNIPHATNNNISRFIYSRDTLLKLSKSPNSIVKPGGLANIDILKGVISETAQDSTAVLETPIYRYVKQPNRAQYHTDVSWRNNNSKPHYQSYQQYTTQQKYIQIDRSDLMPLSQNEDGYLTAKKRKQKGEEVNEIEEMTRQIKGVLNKIVPQNFSQCLNDLVNLKIETHDGMKCLVNEIFLKAVKEEAYSVTFAKICKCLDSIKADVSENEIMKFRSVLLLKCQTMFTTPLKEQLENVRLDWMNKADKEKPKTKALMISDVEEQVKKAKDRYYGNIRFIGELYLQNILMTKIIIFCIDSLTTEDPESLICLCKLLETTGAKLETDAKGIEKLNETFKKLREWSEDTSIQKRVRFRLMDILEMRKQNWSLRHIQKEQKVEPKTLNEIKKDSERQSLLLQKQFASAQNENRDVHYNSLNRKANVQGWSGDRRMSVPGNAINSTNNSAHNMNRHNRGGQYENFNLKNLSFSNTISMNDNSSFVPAQSRPWNKGSGFKSSSKQNSVDYTNNEQRSINDNKFNRNSFQKNSKFINQSMPSSTVSRSLGPSNSIVSITTPSPSSSRSSSNSRKPLSISSSSLSQQESFNKHNDNKSSQPMYQPELSPGTNDSIGEASSSSANLMAVTKQCIKDDLLTRSKLLKLYLKEKKFCNKSWCSYNDKTTVVYDWIDEHIEESFDVRTQISSLLVNLVNKNSLDRQELLEALRLLSGSLEDLQIDVGIRIWDYFNDFLIGFGNDSLVSSPSSLLLNQIFNISEKLYEKQESYIEYYTLPWFLLNRMKLSEQQLTEIGQLPVTQLAIQYLDKALDSLWKVSFRKNKKDVDIDNCLYIKWLHRCIDESLNDTIKRLFIKTNWMFMLKKLNPPNDLNYENECQSSHPIMFSCRCLSKFTNNQEHFESLTKFIGLTALSQKSILHILWFLYQLNDTFSDCDLKCIVDYWKKQQSIESRETLQTTNQIYSFNEFCVLLTNQIRNGNDCNFEILNSTTPQNLKP